MKMLCLIVLMAVAAGAAARAQSNTNAATELLPLTDIYAEDSADFDWIKHTATYRGNVCVSNAEIKLTCQLLVANFPESGGRLNRVVAETNVVIDAKDDKGHPIHATSSKAVYNYSVQNGTTNETITLTGDPQPQVITYQATYVITNWADEIVWDRTSRGLRSSGNYHQSIGPVSAGTNAPAASTNAITSPTSNSLPGTIDNIDRITNPPQQMGF